MAYINYVLTSVVVGLGILVGLLIGSMAKEELKQGNKYFSILQLLAITAVFFVFGYSRYSLLISTGLALTALLVAVFLLGAKQDIVVFLILGIVFYLSSSTGTFALLASLVFIFTLPTGSLFIARKKGIGTVALLSGIFLVLTNGLFFLFQYI